MVTPSGPRHTNGIAMRSTPRASVYCVAGCSGTKPLSCDGAALALLTQPLSATKWRDGASSNSSTGGLPGSAVCA